MGPEDRFRTSVGVVGCLQCPGCCSAPDPAGQNARGEVNVGRPVVEHQSTKDSGGGGQGATGGSLEAAVGIPGWQLVKRYCGEIGSQALRDDLDTEIPRVAHRLSGVGKETASSGEGRASR